MIGGVHFLCIVARHSHLCAGAQTQTVLVLVPQPAACKLTAGRISVSEARATSHFCLLMGCTGTSTQGTSTSKGAAAGGGDGADEGWAVGTELHEELLLQ